MIFLRVTDIHIFKLPPHMTEPLNNCTLILNIDIIKLISQQNFLIVYVNMTWSRNCHKTKHLFNVLPPQTSNTLLLWIVYFILMICYYLFSSSFVTVSVSYLHLFGILYFMEFFYSYDNPTWYSSVWSMFVLFLCGFFALFSANMFSSILTYFQQKGKYIDLLNQRLIIKFHDNC